MSFEASTASPAVTGGHSNLNYAADSTPASAGGPPVASNKTLASFVADLQANLRDAFEPARTRQHVTSANPQTSAQGVRRDGHASALMHPLAISTAGQSTSNAFSSTPTLQLPWELLTSALSRFEYQVLNAGLTSASNLGDPTQLLPLVSGVGEKDRIRLLALMREAGALTLADVTTDAGVQLSKKILDRRKDYKVGYPGSFAGKHNVKEILESIAKDAGWETYQGADDDDAGEGLDASGMQTDSVMQGNDGSHAQSHTITMAGKGIVLDIDLELPSSVLSGDDQPVIKNSFGIVTAARFSYGMEGSTDADIDKLLSGQAKSANWPALRESLLTLAKLDDVIGMQESMSRDEDVDNANGGGGGTDSSGDLDPFSAMKALTLKVEEIFKSELEVASSATHLFTTGHGLALAYHTHPYIELIYHVEAYVLHTDEWDKTVQLGFQNEELASLSRLEGVRSIKFGVMKGSTTLPSGLAMLHDPSMDSKNGSKASFPLLSTPIPGLTDEFANGLHFVAKLDQPLFISAAAGRRIQDILLGTDVASLYPNMQLQLFQMAGQQQNLPFQQANIPTTLERYLLPHIAANTSYNLNVDDIEATPPMRAKLHPLSATPAFILEQFAFETVDQLMAIVEILRMQSLYNDLLQTVFEDATIVSITDDPEANITLDDLLSDEPLSTMDVTVQTNTDGSWPPSLALSFLLPQLPSRLPVTASIAISPSSLSPTGNNISCDLSGSNGTYHDVKDAATLEQIKQGISRNNSEGGKAAMDNVMAASRDLKALVGQLGRAIDT